MNRTSEVRTYGELCAVTEAKLATGSLQIIGLPGCKTTMPGFLFLHVLKL